MSGALGLGLPTLAHGFSSDGLRVYRPETGDAQPKAMRILILGGTGFIGPYQVQYAIDRKHKVTLFNRGKPMRRCFPTSRD